jgi:thioredoxin reductase (NADPH)
MRIPIIGGGPAGMSCALWLHNFGLRPVIIERADVLGGMARASPYPNDWLLGRPGESGRQNAQAFAHHISRAGIETWTGTSPRRISRPAAGGFELEAASAAGKQQILHCPAIVVATGTSFAGEEWLDQVRNARALAQAGLVQLGPTGIGEGAKPGIKSGIKPGSRVVVVGGGDNAFDVSRMLAEQGAQVTVIMRAARPRARPQLVERLAPHQGSGLVEVVAERTVVALDDDGGARLTARLNDGRQIGADRVVLLIGYRPNSREAWLTGLAPRMDDHGYLMVDERMETSCPGLFAAGDIADPAHPAIATAVASGAVAAREIQRRLAA